MASNDSDSLDGEFMYSITTEEALASKVANGKCCLLCGRTNYLANRFFQYKLDKRESRSWRHTQAQFIEEFFGLNVIGDDRVICRFCLKSLHKADWLWVASVRNPATSGHHPSFDILYKLQFTRISTKLSCLNAMCSALESMTRKRKQGAPQ